MLCLNMFSYKVSTKEMHYLTVAIVRFSLLATFFHMLQSFNTIESRFCRDNANAYTGRDGVTLCTVQSVVNIYTSMGSVTSWFAQMMHIFCLIVLRKTDVQLSLYKRFNMVCIYCVPVIPMLILGFSGNLGYYKGTLSCFTNQVADDVNLDVWCFWILDALCGAVCTVLLGFVCWEASIILTHKTGQSKTKNTNSRGRPNAVHPAQMSRAGVDGSDSDAEHFDRAMAMQVRDDEAYRRSQAASQVSVGGDPVPSSHGVSIDLGSMVASRNASLAASFVGGQQGVGGRDTVLAQAVSHAAAIGESNTAAQQGGEGLSVVSADGQSGGALGDVETAAVGERSVSGRPRHYQPAMCISQAAECPPWPQLVLVSPVSKHPLAIPWLAP